MLKKEIENYKKLNKLAENSGIVIFGEAEDRLIPIGELKQAFSLDFPIYNRSFESPSLSRAAEIYVECIAQLNPETIFLHIGLSDIELFTKNPRDFDTQYRRLLDCIKKHDKTCHIIIVSLKNPDNLDLICEINRHLKYIASSEQCEFSDLSANRVWNPIETKSVLSFLYSTGFVRPLDIKRPTYDLTGILFCCPT